MREKHMERSALEAIPWYLVLDPSRSDKKKQPLAGR